MQKLILALCVCLSAAAPWPFSMWRGSSLVETSSEAPTLPSFYHTTPQMAEQVKNLVGKCNGLSVETVRDGARELQVARYKSPGSWGSKFKTMVVAGEHARELIGSEIALNFVMALCGQAHAADIEEAKKDTEFLVVMNANPGSRALVEQGDFCTRVSPDKVDINRNFDINWQTAEHGNGDTNPGEHAFDQSESRILKLLMEKFQPHAYLDLHSGFRGMFFPNQVANDKELSMQLQRLTAPVDEATCKCPLGVANEQVGYHTAGSALDYTFSVLKVPFSMAVEVYVNENDQRTNKKLEKRWNDQKSDLLKPLATGSSFMENAISPDTMIPMSLIQSGDHSELDEMAPAGCLKFFNPIKKESFDRTVNSWTNAVAQLSIKSRAIAPNAASEVERKHPGSFKQKIQEEPQQESPVWFALKTLGLLLVIYAAFKYYKAKQMKSVETEPITAQMAPIQISD